MFDKSEMFCCRRQRPGAICRQPGQLRRVRDVDGRRQCVVEGTEERDHSEHAVVDGTGDETRSEPAARGVNLGGRGDTPHQNLEWGRQYIMSPQILTFSLYFSLTQSVSRISVARAKQK